ncbi:exported hypothetical protein [Candidatus Sulfopaludibacter sp. SbA4]|nr:exported hypothetical protein [Candidatus Sulfopaludibacter sp. SbA4]
MNRLAAVVLWVTASLVLLEATYPSTTLLVWNRAGYWKKIPVRTLGQMAKVEEYRWAGNIGNRKLIVGLEQWEQENMQFKEWPDFTRMLAEASITALIGGGLVYAIRRTTRAEVSRDNRSRDVV